ncbi:MULTISPECIES: DUF2235 domain-containing protein [unclassified Oceanicaulis]|uniref:DUF2235 domain-containing protein n=1 Tax=unclassified Oceanicaulis TaxID=2632123 RepID=UPI0025FBDEC4|nr:MULTISPECIES: DUF2235 domain-containing protein [unclassified Oceanicaulis]
MKRLIVCCDGTWQTISQKVPTNVAKLAFSLDGCDTNAPDGPVEQIVYYDSGVGTPFTQNNSSWFNRLVSSLKKKRQGAFGGGLEEKIYDAYRFLSLNYREGDQIWLFGFSRGAYTVRSLAGLIYNSGLLHRRNLGKLPDAYALYRSKDLKPSSWTCQEFRERNGYEPDIHFLGCWDTVGALGIPDLSEDHDLNERLNEEYRFHDAQLNRKVLHARHACALDESRKAFPLTPMEASRDAKNDEDPLKQIWFIGPHGGVGGGESANTPFSDIALKWMADEAREKGLAIEYAVLDSRLEPDPLAELKPPKGLLSALGDRVRQAPEPSAETLALFHPSVWVRFDHGDLNYRPESMQGWADADRSGWGRA